MVIKEPFQHWGLDFIGVISPNSSMDHKFILTATNYLTRWLEVMPCKNAYQEVVIDMIKRIITHIGIPQIIVSDNSPMFIGANLSEFVVEYRIY